MQDRYFGDVGDYAKYALLRAIGRQLKPLSKLGVIWYFFPDESHNGDGRHVTYLMSDGYRSLDPELHDTIAALLKVGRRRVAEVSASAILPPSTIYFQVPTIGIATVKGRSERLAARTHWFQHALAATRGADVVFLDPDNGVEVASVPKYAPKAGKYVYWDEIEELWQEGRSLVVYHHLNRTAKASFQTEALRAKFTERLAPRLVQPLLFRRGSCRHFWIIGQKRHARALEKSVAALLSSGWSRHFETG